MEKPVAGKKRVVTRPCPDVHCAQFAGITMELTPPFPRSIIAPPDFIRSPSFRNLSMPSMLMDSSGIIKGNGQLARRSWRRPGPAHRHPRQNQPTGMTNARHANPWKSRSAMVAFWFPASTDFGLRGDLEKIAVFENSFCQKERMAVPLRMITPMTIIGTVLKPKSPPMDCRPGGLEPF